MAGATGRGTNALPLHGAAFWEISEVGLRAAAATVYGLTGTVNMSTRALKVSARSLAPSVEMVV